MVNLSDRTIVDKEKYLLVLQFDKEQIAKVNPWDEIFKLLHEANIMSKVSTDENGHLFLTISGALADVDCAHTLINRFLIRLKAEGKEVDFFRLKDDVSEEIRYLSYPIIASIECAMRVFLDRSGTSVCGLAEWHWITSSTFKDGIRQTGSSQKTRSHHVLTPLESVYLHDLIDIMNPKCREKYAQKTCPNDILEQAEIIATLDEIYRLFFDRQQEWIDIKKDFTKLTGFRNDVMHQHPMSLTDFDDLRVLERKIGNLLGHAKERLSDKELAQAQDGIDKIVRILSTDFCHGTDEITVIKRITSEQG